MTATTLITILTGMLAVGFAHIARKTLFDYIDMGDLYRKAKESAIGSAIVFAGICLVMFGLLGLFGNQVRAETISNQMVTNQWDYKTFKRVGATTGKTLVAGVPWATDISRRTGVSVTIPENSYELLPLVRKEQERLWSSHPNQLA